MNGILDATDVNSIFEIFIVLPFEHVTTSIQIDFHKLLEFVVGVNLCYHQYIIKNEYFTFAIKMIGYKF